MSAIAPGPRTDAGKAVSRFNPLRHGLTSQHLILPGENPDDFHALHQQIRSEWTPEHPDEEALVAKIAESEWRMIRARRVETATLKLYIERILAEEPAPSDVPDFDRALALVYDRYGRELDRLRRYETTISRALAKDRQQLRDLLRGRAEFENGQHSTASAGNEIPGFVSQNLSQSGSHDAADALAGVKTIDATDEPLPKETVSATHITVCRSFPGRMGV